MHACIACHKCAHAETAACAAHPASTLTSATHLSPVVQFIRRALLGSHLPRTSFVPTIAKDCPKCTLHDADRQVRLVSVRRFEIKVGIPNPAAPHLWGIVSCTETSFGFEGACTPLLLLPATRSDTAVVGCAEGLWQFACETTHRLHGQRLIVHGVQEWPSARENSIREKIIFKT